MSAVSIAAPAKLNLYLAVTGRRPDGYHDLVSVAALLDWGDTVEVDRGPDGLALSCDDPTVPADAENLVVRAARALERETGERVSARIALAKRIPSGAGLGGASSDAAAALRGLNALRASPLAEVELARIGAAVGSDCPLFFAGGPCVMRGRGERVDLLGQGAAARITGRRVLVFKPAFPIATPWAYRRLAEGAPRSYVEAARAEAHVESWAAGAGPLESLLFNSMEAPAFVKYPALPILLERLRDGFGVAARMSGSGSACYCLLPEGLDAAPLGLFIRAAWGSTAFVREGRLI